MRLLIVLALLVAGIALAEDELSIPAADDWYTSQYAPLYRDNPWEKAAEIAGLNFELLNETTASFKAKWRDYYSGGNIGYECGWYLADLIDGKWLITEYATIACGKHGL